MGDKKFIFPDAFSGFLILKDKAANSEINAMLNKRLEEQNEQKQKNQEEQKRRNRIRTLKIAPNSQAAFNVSEKDIDEVFLSGAVSTGCYLSGYSKGEPRIPNRIKPNSACLLTHCPKDAPEKERRIIGAFMVKEDFFGDLCRSGIVEGHKQYIVHLTSEEELSFWDYFSYSQSVSRWGNTVFKYFSNDIMQQILLDMQKVLAGTEKEAVTHKFYQYFCEMNRLPDIKSD
ncbi:MAG: hypothetical protein RSF82_02225 [Angelakisella sp.]